MSSVSDIKQSCALCKKSIGALSSWVCNNCSNIFHEKCVQRNDNISSWNCLKCKQLRVPPPPKSRQSSRKTAKSNKSKASAEIQLELINEEAKLLEKHREQKQQHFAEAEKSMKVQQEKELELLHKKQEIIKSINDEMSVRSNKSLLVFDKNREWRAPNSKILQRDNDMRKSNNNAEEIPIFIAMSLSRVQLFELL